MPVSRSKRKREQQVAVAAESPGEESSSSPRRTGPEPNTNKNSKIIKKNEITHGINNSSNSTDKNTPLEEATTNKTSKQPQEEGENTTTSTNTTNFPLTETTPSKPAAAPAAGPTVSSEEGGNDQAESSLAEAVAETASPNSQDSPSGARPLHETTTKNTATQDDSSKTMIADALADASSSGTSGALKVETAASTGESNSKDDAVQSNVAAAAAENNDTHNNQLDEEQLSRIRLFLSHRKLLLERVIQGRAAVQHRLSVLNSENPEKANETEQQEMTVFAALSKEATSMARKQTRAEGDGGGGVTVAGSETINSSNKRTSLSLRRGSSVGKRMNAALSSLAPGTATHAAAAVAAAAAATASSSSSVAAAAAPSVAMPIKSSVSTGAARAAAAAATTTIAAPSVTLASVAPAQQQQPLSSIPSLPVAPPLKKTAALVRLNSQKNASRPPSVVRNVSQAASAIAAAAAAHQQQQQQQQQHMIHHHQQLAASILYTTNLLGAPIRPKQPGVVLPQAAALRERRNEIQQRLKDIMTQQQQRIQQQHAEASHAPLIFNTSSTPQKSSAESATALRTTAASAAASATTTAATTATRPLSRLMHAMTVKGCARPTKLPPRRRTHWDYLLQEMQWAATDFIEERKWKVASSKLLANEVTAAPEQQPTAAAAVVVALAVNTQQHGGNAENVLVVQEKTCAEPKNGANHDEQQAASMECDDDDDNVKKGSAISRKEKKQVSRRLYKDPNAEDAKQAQLAAQTASALISDFAAAVNSLRSTTTTTSLMLPSPKQRTRSEEMMDESHPLSDVSNKDEAYKLISARIDGVLKLKQTTLGSSTSSNSKSSKKDFGIELSEQQRAAIDFVQRRWNTDDESVGAIMGGPLGSGKTLATCALLWRHRRDGPHLVLCSPLSTLKWMMEIRRFDGLQVVSGNSAAWSESAEIDGNDVVVCEYDALSKIPDDRLRSFGTVIVDCRFPMGFRGSRPKSILEKTDHLHAAPRALSTPSWWSNLTSSVLGSKAKTLLVYVSSPSETEGYWDALPQRQLLECLALRMSFLLGTSAFQAPMWSIEKTVLGWSRKRIKGTDYTGTKFQKVHKLLIDLIDPCFYPIKDSKNQEESFSWELRTSDMSPQQRSAYDDCCLDVRGALAKTPATLSERGERFCSMADALLRLRRLCMHANLDEVLADPTIRARTGLLFGSKRKDSPSQPCHEVAKRILSGSGKLRDLISMMVNDAAFELHVEVRDILEQVKGRKNSSFKARKPPQKIAILAALPEVQVLVSVLLNALGISHELLLNSTIFPAQYDPSLVFEKGSLSWAECQIALSKFNEGSSSSSSDDTAVNVLIASPALVAGDHGGIGVEAADHVVILDEDWSGRSELLTHALLVRCCSKSNCVRLVSADTCEHKFVSHGGVDSKGKNRSKTDLPWPLDPFGSFTTPGNIPADKAKQVSELWSMREHGKHMFNFPGVNIFSCCGELFSEVLSCSKPLPRLFGSTSDLLFLPFEKGESGVQSEIGLIHNLVEKEAAAGIRFGDALNRESGIQATALPPLPTAVAHGLTSQDDLTLLSIRHNFRCFANTLDTDSASSENSVPTLPSDRADANLVPSNGDGSDETDSVEEAVVVAPREAARALLCYSENFHSSDRVQAPFSRASSRRNIFSVAFSGSRDMLADGDGNQGSEPLVYFPPIFPRLLESSVLAGRSVESLRSEWPGAKRRASDQSSYGPDSKRARIDQEAEVMEADPNRIVTEDEASRSDAASVLLDLADDYGLAGIGAVPLPRDSALSAGLDSVGTTTSGAYSAGDSIFIAGSAPCDSEEADLVGRVGNCDSRSMILFVSRKRQRGYPGLPHSAAQTHRSQHGLLPGMGMPWTSLTPAASAISMSSGGNGPVHDLNGAGLGGKKLKKKKEESVSGSAFNRLPQFDPFLATPSAAQGSPQMSNMRDLYRSRVLAACRQSGAGTTLFEAPAFRAAVVRMRNKIGDRLARHCWQSSTAFEVGPGLPLLVSKYHGPSSEYRGLFEVNENLWTSIVKRLKNASASTGDEAIEISIAQRAALRRSLVAPCRVDFGPFQIGFISSPSGMTAIAPPRPRPGVSLPMGVKVPQITREQSLPWTVKEDQELHRCAVRFGTNWILAARLLSGYDDVVLVSRQTHGTRRLPRASRSCREHWQALARSNPLLANEVRQSERLQREHAAFKSEQQAGEVVPYRRSALPASSSSTEVTESDVPWRKIEFLVIPSTDTHDVQNQTDEKGVLPADDDIAMTEASKQSPRPKLTGSDPIATGTESSPSEKSESSKKRRSFSAIVAARANRKTAPIAIPGMGNGSQPTVAPSHPSHLQSVQSSIAASWTGVRADMWPLQLLDAADRHKASVSAATTTTPAVPAMAAANSNTRLHNNSSTSSSSSRVPANNSGSASGALSQSSHHHHYHHMAPSSSGGANPRPLSTNAHPSQLQQPPPSNSSRGAPGPNRSMQSFAPPPQHQQQQQQQPGPPPPPPTVALRQPPPSQKGQQPQQQQQQRPPIQK